MLTTWIATIGYFLQTEMIARAFSGLAERTQALAGIVHHMTDQLPLMGLVYDPPLRLVANRIRNMPAGITWNGYEWDVV